MSRLVQRAQDELFPIRDDDVVVVAPVETAAAKVAVARRTASANLQAPHWEGAKSSLAAATILRYVRGDITTLRQYLDQGHSAAERMHPYSNALESTTDPSVILERHLMYVLGHSGPQVSDRGVATYTKTLVGWASGGQSSKLISEAITAEYNLFMRARTVAKERYHSAAEAVSRAESIMLASTGFKKLVALFNRPRSRWSIKNPVVVLRGIFQAAYDVAVHDVVGREVVELMPRVHTPQSLILTGPDSAMIDRFFREKGPSASDMEFYQELFTPTMTILKEEGEEKTAESDVEEKEEELYKEEEEEERQAQEESAGEEEKVEKVVKPAPKTTKTGGAKVPRRAGVTKRRKRT